MKYQTKPEMNNPIPITFFYESDVLELADDVRAKLQQAKNDVARSALDDFLNHDLEFPRHAKAAQRAAELERQLEAIELARKTGVKLKQAAQGAKTG